MSYRPYGRFAPMMTAVSLGISCLMAQPTGAGAQTVEDGSDAALGKEDTRTVLSLARSYLEKGSDPKITALRRSKGALVCGTVDVKGKDGRYLGERGFIVDLSIPSFARVPEGVELLNPRVEGFEEKEQVRQQYFAMCLD